MAGFRIEHVGLHVRNIEEELEFLKVLGGELTAVDRMGRGRIAFVSLNGDNHHNFALFEDGEPLPSGDSQKENRGIDHIAMATDSRESVDDWGRKLQAQGIPFKGPSIQGPEGGGLDNGSGSYAIFFTDPNGVCFEIYSGAMTVAEFRHMEAERQRAKHPV